RRRVAGHVQLAMAMRASDQHGGTARWRGTQALSSCRAKTQPVAGHPKSRNCAQRLLHIPGGVVLHFARSRQPEGRMRTITAFALVATFALSLVQPTRAEEERGYIGVMIKKSTEGIEILGVVGDSPAAKAGLKEGDVIKKLDGEEVATVALED